MYFIKRNSDTLTATEKFLANTTPYGEVKCIRLDNGGEFISQKFKSLLQKNKIKHEMFAPHSPHQNAMAERHWRTCLRWEGAYSCRPIWARWFGLMQ